MLEVVGAIIIHPEKGILLQQRDEKVANLPLAWTLFGGIVESGELPEEAVIRELEEELSLKTTSSTNLKLFKTYIQKNGTNQHIYSLAVNFQLDLNELILNEEKTMQFFHSEEIFNRDFACNIKDVLEDYLQIA